SNLSKLDRAILAERMHFTAGNLIGRQQASDGVIKLLIDWSNAAQPNADATALPVIGDPRNQTECVMIPAKSETRHRRTACISSQVGCPVGCRFCASGLGGLDGNLTAGQIVEQVWQLQ